MAPDSFNPKHFHHQFQSTIISFPEEASHYSSMSQNRKGSSPGCDGVGHGQQALMISRASFSNNDDTVTDIPFSHAGPSFVTLSTSYPNAAFTSNPRYGSPISCGPTIHSSQPPNNSFPDHIYTDMFAQPPQIPRNRLSMQLSPLLRCMELPVMFKHEGYAQPTAYHQFSHDFNPVTTGCSPVLEPMTSPLSTASNSANLDAFYGQLDWHQNLPGISVPESDQSAATVSDGISDEEAVYEKPYAQLIYEALIQAPGHRMLLRDIYEWFIQNTRKPRDSGSNGWQNSIRHNLSMNQAFENDKTDPEANRGARKANSMWVLTEHAIKYGVQSTTRFRKIASSKKGSSNRTPAIQRQRSGAKGGRAARRAARLKRQEEGGRRAKATTVEHDAAISSSGIGSPISTFRDDLSSYSQSPATPAENQIISCPYNLPYLLYHQYGPKVEPKYEVGTFTDEEEHLRRILSHSSSDDYLERAAHLS